MLRFSPVSAVLCGGKCWERATREDVFIVPEWTGSWVKPGRRARAKGCEAGGHVRRTRAGGEESNCTLRGRQRRAVVDV